MQNIKGLIIENSSIGWDKADYKNPSLIKGLLRRGQKMLIAAPPRSIKTSLVVQLSKAIADGEQWLQWEVQQGDVLIVGCGSDKQNMLNRISKLYEKEAESKSYEFIDYVTIKGETSMPTVINQVIDSVRKQGKTYRLIILDSIDYVQPLEGYSVHSTIAALDRLTIECNCSVVVTHTVRREFSDKSYIDNLNVIHSDILLTLFDTYIEFVELKLTEKDLNDLQVGQAKDYFVEALKEHRPEYYKANIPGNFFQKERAIDELRRHLEIAIPEDKQDSVLNFFDGSFNPMKHETYWQMVATSVEFPDLPSEKYVFRYPLLEADNENILDMYEVGTFAFWRSHKKIDEDEKKIIDRDEANKELSSAIKKFEEDEHNRGIKPHKNEIAKILGVSPKTISRRVEASDMFYITNGRILKF